MKTPENPKDIALICNIIITIVFIILLLIALLSKRSCPEVKVVEPTKPKTQSVPVDKLLDNLEKQENFTLPEKLKIKKKPTDADIEKDRQLLIFLLQEYLEKQKAEDSQEIIKLLDDSITNIEATTEPPSFSTTSPPDLN
jgi:hypothetical protein